MADDRATRLGAFLGKCSKSFGEGRVSIASGAKATSIKRYSSGIFRLDQALGGGWPFSRICLVHGVESSGKTTTAIKGMANIEKYCSVCHNHKTQCSCSTPFVPCRGLWVDQEGTFEKDWAEALGFNVDNHLLAKPDTAEDAIELITAALEERAVDVVILDSIEACIPKTEIEDEATKQMPGLRARMLNKAFRRWMNIQTRQGDSATSLTVLNQEREKIGVMYGDPMTLPGGKGQLFAASIRLRLLRGEVKDIDGCHSAVHQMKANTPKNKTYTPKLECEFPLSLRDHDGFKKGEFKNAGSVFKEAKELGLLGHKFKLPDKDGTLMSFKTDADVVDWLRTDPIIMAGPDMPVMTAMEYYWMEVLRKCL